MIITIINADIVPIELYYPDQTTGVKCQYNIILD